MFRWASPRELSRNGGNVSDSAGEAWEDDDCVRRTVVLPVDLAERLAAEAERRGLSVSDLLAEYAEQGLRGG
jgi:CopG-like RHH_1 or ribbon-helix-helix domain, RHH_5